MLTEAAAANVEAGAAVSGTIFVSVKINDKYLFNASDGGKRTSIPGASWNIGTEAIIEILEDARSSTATCNWLWTYYLTSDSQRHALRHTLVQTMNSFMVAQRNKYKHFDREWRGIHPGNIGIGDRTVESIEKLEPDKQRLLKSYYRCMHLMQAPIFVFFTVKRSSAESRWLEHGGFLRQTIARAAAIGLVAETGGFAPFHNLLREIFQWNDAETPICGMSVHGAFGTVIDGS